MKLKRIIKDLPVRVAKGSKEIEITGISSHSKIVGPGNLYIAKKGAKYDGNDFIQEAIAAGAVAIITDIFNPFLEGVTQIIAENVESIESEIARNFYGDPASDLSLIGITGTSGKTTTTYLLKYLLEANWATGLIGTIERIIGDMRLRSDLTTPDCLTLYKIFHEMRLAHIEKVCMEVSSHALTQNRVEGLHFDLAIYTNLSEEHLDYHDGMEAYREAKAKLFAMQAKDGVALLNRDDPYTPYMEKAAKGRVVFYGIDQEGEYQAKEIVSDLEGSRFIWVTPEGEYPLQVPLIGRFNVYNTLAAVSGAHLLGVSVAEIQKRLPHFSQVAGRLQKVPTREGFHIFVDFAHKPDALKKVLEALEPLKKGRLITLFGCGGERDREKRPKMAHIAEQFSDLVILTSDNPRGENPLDIIEEIREGFKQENHLIEPDRKEAIRKGIEQLKEGDILLIAGKGHETEQIFHYQHIAFDDAKIAEEIYVGR